MAKSGTPIRLTESEVVLIQQWRTLTARTQKELRYLIRRLSTRKG